MPKLLTDMTPEEIDVYAEQLFNLKPKPTVLPKPTSTHAPKRKSGSHRHGAPKRNRVGVNRKPQPKIYVDDISPVTINCPPRPEHIIPDLPPEPQPPTIVSPVNLLISSVADPAAYVLDVFDNFLAPGIGATSPTLEIIRRAIYRRAVGEFATEEIKLMSALHSICVEDILTITMASVNKAGLILI